jgi:hypothetical protein
MGQAGNETNKTRMNMKKKRRRKEENPEGGRHLLAGWLAGALWRCDASDPLFSQIDNKNGVGRALAERGTSAGASAVPGAADGRAACGEIESR